MVIYRTSGGVDAIDEHSRRLVAALCEAGVPACYEADGLSVAQVRSLDPDWILLQYNPFAYGHWGFAPGLIPNAIALRRQTGAPLAVFVHEAWVDTLDRARARWRSALLGSYQRVQLKSLLRVADVVIGATQGLARKLGNGAVHVPVASNVTPVSMAPREARARLGVGDELVVALFGTGHPSRALDYAESAIEALATRHGADGLRVLNLGHGAPPLDLSAAIEVSTPGRLAAEEVSLHLRATDVLLLPLVDGISTRRTTLMAGLAHAVPVVGLRGVSTDDVLVDHPEALTLTPVGDRGAYARATAELTVDRDRMKAAGEAGRDLYADQFDWPIAAGRVTSALRAVWVR